VLKEIVDSVPIPIVAIGGINPDNVVEVMKTANPAGIACVSAIMAVDNPREAARRFLTLIKQDKTEIQKGSPEMLPIKKQVLAAFLKIKESKPLICHITNNVVMNVTANATLHVGASPVMIMSYEESEEMASKSNALVLNPGTPTSEQKIAMSTAGNF
jgi:hypothetical protein